MSKKILVLDTGKEWGGGTNSLLEFLRRSDSVKYQFVILFYHNVIKPDESDIRSEVEKLGIQFMTLERRGQPAAVKILKELGRTLLFFNEKLKRKFVFHIDYLFRIKNDARSITKILKDQNIDLLYMNNQPSSNLEGIIAAQEAGIRSLLHSRIETDLNPFEVNAVNRSLTKMICVSEGVRKNFIDHGVESSKCTVIHNGIDSRTTPAVSAEKIRHGLKIKDNEILIGSAGSLIKRKRFNDLIEVVSRLIRSRPSLQIKCLILGDGPEKENLQKMIDRSGLNGNIILGGFKPDAISYINAMDIFVLPSEREGLPRVILEAMLMKKPVIASCIPGPSELIINERTGFLFQPGNVGELYGRISSLLSSAVLREGMGESGRKRVVDHFSIEQYVDEVSSILAEVTS